jgi:hypothetical protein
MLNLIAKMCSMLRSNQGRKVLKFGKFDEKREITPKWVMRFTSKLEGG